MRRSRSADDSGNSLILNSGNEIIRTQSAENIHKPGLLRARSDPYLSIPRASLTRDPLTRVNYGDSKSCVDVDSNNNNSFLTEKKNQEVIKSNLVRSSSLNTGRVVKGS